MKTKKSLGFSIIDFGTRADLKVSVIEYVFMHMVFNLYDPERGGCYMSKESFASRLGVSSRAIFAIIQRLSDKGYIKNKKGVLTLTPKIKGKFSEFRIDKKDEEPSAKYFQNRENTSQRRMKKDQRSDEDTSQVNVKKDQKSYADSSQNNISIRRSEKENKLSEEERNLLSALIQEITTFFREAESGDVKRFLLSFSEEQYTEFILAFEYNSNQAQDSKLYIKLWSFFKKQWKQYSYSVRKDNEQGVLPEGEMYEYFAGLRERGKQRRLDEYTVRILTKYLKNRSK